MLLFKPLALTPLAVVSTSSGQVLLTFHLLSSHQRLRGTGCMSLTPNPAGPLPRWVAGGKETENDSARASGRGEEFLLWQAQAEEKGVEETLAGSCRGNAGRQ